MKNKPEEQPLENSFRGWVSNCLALSGGASVSLLIQGAAEPPSFVWARRILEIFKFCTTYSVQGAVGVGTVSMASQANGELNLC